MITTLAGTIERRLLVNYRVDPEVMAGILPSPFEPALVGGHAIAGICLIQLRVRPGRLPAATAVRSFNGAHRIAVILPDGRNAVYIPRRDTDSRLNAIVGGRVFPGVQHRATIAARDDGHRLSVELVSRDGWTRVSVDVSITDRLPAGSVFESLEQVSDFFRRGSVGYTDGPDQRRYDCLELRTSNWSVTPLAVHHVRSSFFDDQTMFPAGTVAFDNALLMRDIHHSWHTGPRLPAGERNKSDPPAGQRFGTTIGGPGTVAG